MASTTLAPPKSLDGITARELISAEDSTGGPPTTTFGPNTRGPITLRSGPELVIENPSADYLRVDEGNTDPLTINIAGYKRIAFQCTVQETSVPVGTRLALKVLRFLGGAWEYLNAADEGPWLPVHEVKTDGASGKLIPVLSGWFTMDAAVDADNITFEWGVYGGDGTGEVIIGDIYVELSAATRPPTQEIPEPTPPTDGLYAYWKITEISGQSIDSKAPSPSGRLLYLGVSSGADSCDPTWGTKKLVFGGGVADKDVLSYQDLPSLRYGYAIFFYFEIDNFGTGDKIITGVCLGGLAAPDDHWLTISDSTQRLSATVVEDTSTGITRVATGTSTLDVGFKGVIGFVHDGTNLKVYVNPVDGLPEGTTACGLAKDPSGGRDLILSSSNYPPTVNNINNSKMGDVMLFVGSAVSGLTASKIAEIYATYKARYPTDLP